MVERGKQKGKQKGQQGRRKMRGRVSVGLETTNENWIVKAALEATTCRTMRKPTNK